MDTQFALTKPAMLAHPKGLFEAHAFKDPKTGKERGKPVYSAELVFDLTNSDWDAMRKFAWAVAKSEWGQDIKWGEFTTPFKRGDTLADERATKNAALVAKGEKAKPEAEYMRGKGVMKVKSYRAPDLAGIANNKVTDYEGAARDQAREKFYFGAECLALLNFSAGEVQGAKYVTVYVNNVTLTGGGKRIGGSTSKGSVVFAGYKGGTSDVNPTDDEIPF